MRKQKARKKKQGRKAGLGLQDWRGGCFCPALSLVGSPKFQALGSFPTWGSYSIRRSQLQTARREMWGVSAWVVFMLIQDLLKLRKQAAERAFIMRRFCKESHQHFDRKRDFCLKFSEWGSLEEGPSPWLPLQAWGPEGPPHALLVLLSPVQFSLALGRIWTLDS